MNRSAFTFVCFLVLLWSCNNTPAPVTEVPADIQTIVEPIEVAAEATPGNDEARYAWQKPELVVDRLGDLEGKVIADIGAGTGYFAFRLISKAKKVIAVDIDTDMLSLIETFRVDHLDSLQRSKISTRLATSDSPNLKKGEIDIAMIINTIGFIEDRSAYLENLRSAIMPEGEVVIVDFKMKRIPDNIATPVEYRVSLLELENILEATGYKNITTDDRSLDYQYIVKATRD